MFRCLYQSALRVVFTPTSQRSINDRVMTERNRQIHVMIDCTYGRARVQAELREMGLCVKHVSILQCEQWAIRITTLWLKVSLLPWHAD